MMVRQAHHQRNQQLAVGPEPVDGLKQKTPQAGFTLLEVLIALAVLAVLMMGLLKISAANAQNLWYLENKTLAATIAANHAAEIRLQAEQQESVDGWDEMAGRRWHWQADRLAMSPMDGLQRYRIDVRLQDDPSPYASLIIDLAEES
jgi:general secretion pathway protein I